MRDTQHQPSPTPAAGAKTSMAPLTRPPGEPLPENTSPHSPSSSQATPPTPRTSWTRALPPNITIQRCTSAAHVAGFRRLNTVLLPISYPDVFYREITEDAETAELTRVAVVRDKKRKRQAHGSEQQNGGKATVDDALVDGGEEDADDDDDDAAGKVVGGIRCRYEEVPVPASSYLSSSSSTDRSTASSTGGTMTTTTTPLMEQARLQTDPRTRARKIYIQTVAVQAPYRSLGIGTHLLEAVIQGARSPSSQRSENNHHSVQHSHPHLQQMKNNLKDSLHDPSQMKNHLKDSMIDPSRMKNNLQDSMNDPAPPKSTLGGPTNGRSSGRRDGSEQYEQRVEARGGGAGRESGGGERVEARSGQERGGEKRGKREEEEEEEEEDEGSRKDRGSGKGAPTREGKGEGEGGEKEQGEITEIYGHVWVQNEDALEWYGRRGFDLGPTVDDYYRRLRPSGAVLVRRHLRSPAY